MFAIVTSFFCAAIQFPECTGGGSDHAENQNGGKSFKKNNTKKNNHPRPSNNILIFVATEIPSFRKTSLDFLFHFPCKVFIIIMSSCPQSLLESVLRARHHCCCCCCYARTRRRLFFGGGGAASTCVRTRRCPRRWSHDGSPCRCRWIPSANRSGPGGER